MAGVKLAAGQRVVAFTAVEPTRDNVVVTIAGSSASLPGTEPGSVKVTPYAEYPAKGRATGGVRCHRFLKGEDQLIVRLGRGRAGAGRWWQWGAHRPPRSGRSAGRLRHAWGEPGVGGGRTDGVVAVRDSVTAADG